MIKQVFDPTVSHRFMATFFIKNIPSPLDISFQSISGLGRELNVQSLHQGGDNVSSFNMPQNVSHANLVLERGVMTVTPMMLSFDQILSAFNLHYCKLIVLLLNNKQFPVCSWTFSNAIPVSWSTDMLDANSSKILINTLELAYEKMHWYGVKA